MSLNLDKIGKNLAVIEGGKNNGKIVSVYSGADNKKIKKEFTSMVLDDKAMFQQTVDTGAEREILYITGASGSGKSTYIANYIKQYKKIYKKNSVYVFSALKDDEALDSIGVKRIRIDNDLIENPILVEDFENSLVIFDDIDVISNKKHREAVYSILNQIAEVGRHYKIGCAISNHLPTSRDLRRIINECHSVTYFPHSGSFRGLKYLLMEHMGLDKKDIDKIKKTKSRWATIFKNYPQIVMTQKNIYLMSED
jgi:energy-coupling factor transporter ATP-binding protein EcfA2